MRVFLLLFTFAVLTWNGPAEARMYQWLDTESGNVRLSGEPPPWYRSGESSPRVLVFDNGRLVDDTAIFMPPEQRRALREAAFREVDLRREQDAVKKLERAALREARRREEASAAVSAQSASTAGEEASDGSQKKQAGESQPSAEATGGGMVEQLKALISEWDKRNSSPRKP